MKLFDIVVKVLMIGGCAGLFIGVFFTFELLFGTHICH
jgi:hypothetical protein